MVDPRMNVCGRRGQRFGANPSCVQLFFFFSFFFFLCLGMHGLLLFPGLSRPPFVSLDKCLKQYIQAHTAFSLSHGTSSIPTCLCIGASVANAASRDAVCMHVLSVTTVRTLCAAMYYV
jgi:hypothetical protein